MSIQPSILKNGIYIIQYLHHTSSVMFGQELGQSTGLHKQTEDKTDCYKYSKAGETTVTLVKCTPMYKVSGSLFFLMFRNEKTFYFSSLLSSQVIK